MNGARRPGYAKIICCTMAVGVVVAGCGGGGPAGLARARAAGPAGAMWSRLPVAAYELTDWQVAAQEYLTQRLVKRCMRGFGFGYLPELSAASVRQDVRIQEETDSRRYGVSDPAAAHEYGYHVPVWMGPRVRPGPMTAAERQVLTGLPQGSARPADGSSKEALTGRYAGKEIPRNGCVGQALQELSTAGGNGEGQPSLAIHISLAGFQQAQSDPRVRAVYSRWSACMHSHGYRYATPFQAGSDPRWKMNGPVTREEIKTAVTDVMCKQETNLLGIAFVAESHDEDGLIARHVRALAEVQAEMDARAKAIRQLARRYGA